MAAGRPAIKRLSKPKIRASQAQPSRRGGRRTKSHTPRPAASVATTPAAARSSVSPQQQVQRSYGALLSSRDPIISDVGPLIPLPNFSNDPRLLEEIERINQLRSKNLSLEESEDEQEERCGSQNSLATVALLEFEGGFRAREKMAIAIQLHRPFTVGYDENSDYMIETSTAQGISFRLFAYHCEGNSSREVTVSCEDRSLPGQGIQWNGHQISQDTVLLSHGDVVKAGQQRFTFSSMVDTSLAWDQDDSSSQTPAHRYQYSSRMLGEGTHAIVLLAWDRKHQRQVACKRFKNTDAQTGSIAKEEIRVLSLMRHPNLNGLLDVDEGRLSRSRKEVIVRVIVDAAKGGDLFSYIQQHVPNGGLDEAQVKWIAYQMIKGIVYMHDKGIAHHDIKPENVILVTAATSFPHVQIADFGMAWEDPLVTQKAKGMDEAAFDRVLREPRCREKHMGTTLYAPPEMLINHSSRQPGYSPFLHDSWSLGCTIFTTIFSSHPMTSSAGLPHVGCDVDPEPIILAMEQGVEEEQIQQGKLRQDYVAIIGCILKGLRWEILPPLRPHYGSVRAAKAFLDDLFELDARYRRTMRQALKSQWIESSRRELEEMYRCRVLGEYRGAAGSDQQ